jgi:hypothetical protein
VVCKGQSLVSASGNQTLNRTLFDRNFHASLLQTISFGEAAMMRLFCMASISIALATSSALARGGLAVSRMVHPSPHAGSPPAHAVGNAVQSRHQSLGDGFRRRGPIVIVVGGSYVQQHDAYCAQNYAKYDPASETYLGDDGERYLCPEIAE